MYVLPVENEYSDCKTDLSSRKCTSFCTETGDFTVAVLPEKVGLTTVLVSTTL